MGCHNDKRMLSQKTQQLYRMAEPAHQNHTSGTAKGTYDIETDVSENHIIQIHRPIAEAQCTAADYQHRPHCKARQVPQETHPFSNG